MGKLNDVRTWVLVAAGWGISVSAGLLFVSLQLSESLFAYYAVGAAIFFVAVFAAAGWMSSSTQRRRLFMIAAILNGGICAFGLAGGFVLYGPSLVIFIVLAVLCVARDTKQDSELRSPVQGSA
jgi:MFS family permease